MCEAQPTSHLSAMEASSEITFLIRRLYVGDTGALDALVPQLYGDLHRLAGCCLRSERRDHTLSPTALVNEAYLRLAQHDRLAALDRPQFFAIAGTTMRRVLVDYARTRQRKKRGGGEAPIRLDDAGDLGAPAEADEILALDEALSRLEAINPRGSAVVHHRYFCGLTLEETAELLGMSVKSVQRAWDASRAWLRKEIQPAGLA